MADDLDIHSMASRELRDGVDLACFYKYAFHRLYRRLPHQSHRLSMSEQDARVKDWPLLLLFGLYTRNERGRRIVCRTLLHSTLEFLRGFGPPADFRSKMRSTDTVLTGSAVVHFLMRDAKPSWKPSDVNFVSSDAGFNQFCAYLYSDLRGEELSHHLLRPDEDDPTQEQADTVAFAEAGITERVRVRINDIVFDVSRSATVSPLTPIARGDNTLLYSYLSADTLCVAYPHAFLQRACIFSSGRGTEQHLKLYKDRRFAVYRTAADYWAIPHAVECLPHGYCAKAKRYFADDRSIFMRFNDGPAYLAGDEPYGVERFTAVWMWGGQPCENRGCSTVVEHTVGLAIANMCNVPI